MSNIDELRLRLEDAERRFGLKTAETKQYSVRLVQLVDAVIDDFWVQRRDNERLAFENEEFRSMLMTLLATIEGGDKNNLHNLMADMAERIATLMAAGAGAPAYDPVLERYPEPELDLAPLPESPNVGPDVSGPDPVPEGEPESEPAPELMSEPEPGPQELPEPAQGSTAVSQASVESGAIINIEDDPAVEGFTPDAIAAAVAELASNTEAVAPVLDLAAIPDAVPSAVHTLEAPEHTGDEAAISQPAEEPVDAEFAGPPHDRKNHDGEFADLHNILEDIRELAGLLGTDDADQTTQNGSA
jgi:hypothetical protein